MTQHKPCVYPGCTDLDGNPRITTEGICVTVHHGRTGGCQKRFRRDWRNIIIDWTHLHQQLPEPLAAVAGRGSRGTRDYGHPAEWASDASAEIATLVNNWHDDLADYLGATPPPHPGTTELVRVRAAWNFIDPRIPDLSRQEWVGDTITEIRELHGKIRSRLGLTRPRLVLPAPCPRCELLTLVRSVDRYRDQIDCEHCGHVIRDDHYDFYTRLLLDTLVDTTE